MKLKISLLKLEAEKLKNLIISSRETLTNRSIEMLLHEETKKKLNGRYNSLGKMKLTKNSKNEKKILEDQILNKNSVFSSIITQRNSLNTSKRILEEDEIGNDSNLKDLTIMMKKILDE